MTFTVYLAGGMTNPWREQAKSELSQFLFLEPTRELSHPDSYTARDLLMVRDADITLAFMESDNPSGIGMTLEIGYALGLGKTVVLVNESTNRYTAILESAISLVFHSFSEMVEELRKW
jgi:nucleoside 2-deoxyribosyltransferase